MRAWDAASGRQLRPLAQGGRVTLLAISPDQRSLATLTQLPEASVCVWNLTTSELRRKWSWSDIVLPGHGLAFSNQGSALITFGPDGGLRVLDIATGHERPAVELQFNLPKEASPFQGVIEAAFSAGNRFLAAAMDQTVHVFDVATSVERFSCACLGTTFTLDSTTLAVAIPGEPEVKKLSGGRTRTWTRNAQAVTMVDLASGTSRRIEIRHDTPIALALSPDGKTLAVAGGWRQPMIWLYRTADGKPLDEWAIPAAVARQRGLAFSPDGRSLAAGLSDTTVVIWNALPL